MSGLSGPQRPPSLMLGQLRFGTNGEACQAPPSAKVSVPDYSDPLGHLSHLGIERFWETKMRAANGRRLNGAGAVSPRGRASVRAMEAVRFASGVWATKTCCARQRRARVGSLATTQSAIMVWLIVGTFT